MEQAIGLDVKQIIVFKLDKEEYGVDIQKVTTIEKMLTITRVPKTADYIKGVINLRGEIIPIMDLRSRFHLPPLEETEDNRIIIIKIEDVNFGLIVDAVAEVLHIAEENIEQISSFSQGLSMDYLLGVGKIDNRIVTLLNIENLAKITD